MLNRLYFNINGRKVCKFASESFSVELDALEHLEIWMANFEADDGEQLFYRGVVRESPEPSCCSSSSLFSSADDSSSDPDNILQ